MARRILALGLLADGAALALLIGLSGFVFEGPEGARGDAVAVTLWSVALITIIATAIGALVAARRGRPELGAALAWGPAAAGLLIGLFSL